MILGGGSLSLIWLQFHYIFTCCVCVFQCWTSHVFDDSSCLNRQIHTNILLLHRPQPVHSPPFPFFIFIFLFHTMGFEFLIYLLFSCHVIAKISDYWLRWRHSTWLDYLTQIACQNNTECPHLSSTIKIMFFFLNN